MNNGHSELSGVLLLNIVLPCTCHIFCYHVSLQLIPQLLCCT